MSSEPLPIMFEFLVYLRQRGFGIGVDHFERLQTLLAEVEGPLKPSELKPLLCPLVATSAAQQESFSEAFESFFEWHLRRHNVEPKPVVITEVSTKSIDEGGAVKDESVPAGKPPAARRKLSYVLACASAFALVGVLCLYLANEILLDPEALVPPAPVPELEPWTPVPAAEPQAAPPPVIRGVSPNFGSTEAENQVTISGDGFDGVLGVTFAGVPGTHVEASPQNNQIAVQTPKHPNPEAVDVVVSTTNGQATFYKGFIYVAPTPPAPELDARKLMVLLAAVLAPVVALLALQLLGFYRRRRIIQKQLSRKPLYVWPIETKAAGPPLFVSENFNLAVRLLRRRQVDEFHRLDIPATIRATIKSLGYLSLRYKPATRAPEYLILIERNSFRDHQARFFQELAKALKAKGLFVRHYFFDDPRVCCDEDNSNCVFLADLRYRYKNHRLLIFSDGRRLLDPITGNLAAWTPLFENWPSRVLLTPEPVSGWGLPEEVLASRFLVLPAAESGLVLLADFFEKLSLPKARGAAGGDERPPSLELDYPALTEELRRHLGDEVFQWLCACAVYPELQWDLTLRLGSVLSPGGRLVTEESLLRLVRLPWFRSGSMPDRLRETLIRQLTARNERLVRDEIVSLLEANPPREGAERAVAADAYNLNLAAQRWLRRRDRKGLRDVLKVQPIVDELKSLPVPLIIKILPRPLLQAVSKHGVPAFGLSPAATPALALLTMALLLGLSTLVMPAFGPRSAPTGWLKLPTPYSGSPPFPTSTPAVTYSILPTTGERGKTVPVIISASDCAQSNLQGASLTTKASGLNFKNVAPSDCQLKADISIAPNAAPGKASIDLVKDGQTLSDFIFTVTDVPCPALSISGPTTTTQLPFTLSADIADAPAGQTFTYSWSVSAGRITDGQGTPSISVDVDQPRTTPLTIQATVAVGGLNPSCTQTVSTVVQVLPPTPCFSCPLPFNSIAKRHPIDDGCPCEGSGGSAENQAQNRVKNNFCASGAPVPVTFATFDQLQLAATRNNIPFGGSNLPTDRSVLRDIVTAGGQRIGEGTIVTVEGFVYNAQHQDISLFGFGGESVNCKNGALDWSDIHISLVPQPNGNLCQSVTAEISPHYRPDSWDRFDTHPRISPLVNGLPLKGVRVRITGQLFFDASHKPTPCSAPALGGNPPRRSTWEIHPVYAIEVYDDSGDRWVSLDSWAKDR